MIDLGEDPLKLDRQVCFALSVASRSVIAIYRPLLEPYGLTHPQYLVMLALWERSPRSVKDLGDVAPPRAGDAVAAAQAPGGARVRHPRPRSRADERQLIVELTERGARCGPKPRRSRTGSSRRWAWTCSELEALHAVLTRVIGATA